METNPLIEQAKTLLEKMGKATPGEWSPQLFDYRSSVTVAATYFADFTPAITIKCAIDKHTDPGVLKVAEVMLGMLDYFDKEGGGG